MTRDNLPQAHTSSSLAKAIYRAELPEKFLRELPAQSLYLAIKHNGLLSSADLIQMASLEQCRLLLDLDCWRGDTFSEENFWEWLSLTDDNNDLELLKKLLNFVDYKLIALTLQRYVIVIEMEDASDSPPDADFYTPDKGRTWIKVTNPDATKQFLLNRLLALIFESSIELFYQLLSIKNVATETMLEEESYQERLKRLSPEGIPDPELSATIHAFMTHGEALKKIQSSEIATRIQDITPIQPLVYDKDLSSPLKRLWSECKDLFQLESELTLITNAAFIHYHVDFNELEKVQDLILQTKGALTIGIERMLEKSDLDLLTLYNALGLQGFYKVGLFELHQLRKYAKSISDEALRASADDTELFSLIACAREMIPVIPEWRKFGETGEKLATKTYPLDSLSELEGIRRFIEERLASHIQ